jgi:hypothetical protein
MGFMRALACWLAVATLVLGTPSPAHALDVLPPTYRAQASCVGRLAPAITAGLETRILLGSVPLPRPGHGPVHATARNWMISLAAGGGITFAKPRGDVFTPTAFAQAGVLRRLAGDLEPRVGLVAVGWVRPEALGPAVRFEAKDAFGAQAGWLFIRRGRDGAFLSVDVSIPLIRDILRK